MSKASLAIVITICVGIVATFVTMIVLQNQKPKEMDAPVEYKAAGNQETQEAPVSSSGAVAASSTGAKTFNKLTSEQASHYKAQLQHAGRYNHNVGQLRPVKRLDGGRGIMAFDADGLTLLPRKQYKSKCSSLPKDRDLLRLERGAGNYVRMQ